MIKKVLSLFSKDPSSLTGTQHDLFHIEEWLGETIRRIDDIFPYKQEQNLVWSECSDLFVKVISELDNICALMRIDVTHLTYEPNFLAAATLVKSESSLILEKYHLRQFRDVSTNDFNSIKRSLEIINQFSGIIYAKVMEKRSVMKRRRF